MSTRVQPLKSSEGSLSQAPSRALRQLPPPPPPGRASLCGSSRWLLTAATAHPSPFLPLLQTLLACVRALNGPGEKKKKKATAWNERREQMRWAQTEGKWFWKGNRWEEEKHRRFLISSLVLFLCCVCFVFPSSDWRDYRLCRFYVQVLLVTKFYIFHRRWFSPFVFLLGKQAVVYFHCPLADLLSKWMQYVICSFKRSQRDVVQFCLQRFTWC